MSDRAANQDHRVTPLELFFDLVFVFAFTQVTTLISNDTTWSGLGHGLLIIGALWWAWAGYAWLTNTVDAGIDAVGGAMLVAMAAMFIAALAVPGAFGEHGVYFGVAFLLVAVMHVSLFALAGRGDSDLLGAVLRIVPTSVVGAVLIMLAGVVEGALRPALWVAALAIGYIGPLFTGVSGWRVEPAHFAERHGLILIIALGESFVAIGLGANGTTLGVGVTFAAVLGLAIATSFWLAYFDFFAIRGQRLLEERTGEERAALARDAYTYLHLPMVIGIVLFALAMKKTLAHVIDELDTIPALALCGGSALFLFSHVALRVRISRTVGRGRFVAAVTFVLLFPVALVVPALAALALVAATWAGLHAYEIIWWREARAQTRALRVPASAS